MSYDFTCSSFLTHFDSQLVGRADEVILPLLRLLPVRRLCARERVGVS